MSRSLRDVIGHVAADLSEAGVDLPFGWLEQIRDALRPLDLDTLHPGQPDEFLTAHFVFMNATLDDVTTLIFLQATADAFAASIQAMKPAFRMAGKNPFMTRIVLNRRLSSRYFHEGRRRIDDPATAASGAWLLKRCLNIALDIVDRDDRATPDTRKTMHSQIATACAHLARQKAREDPDREVLLRTGLTNSLAAERHGDRSPDHDGYAIELALRLHELTNEPSLASVQGALERTRNAATATLQGLHGDVRFACAMVTRDHAGMSRAIPDLLAALDHYDRAIALPRDHRSADVGYHLSKRGRCHALLYEQAGDQAGRRDTISLDRALSDWLDPRAAPHRQNHETARLLLARARLAAARSDTAAAKGDISAAAQLLAGQNSPDHSDRLGSQALGAALDHALDCGAREDAIEVLTDAAALPMDAPAPAGSMTRAAMWLFGRMDRPEWEELALTVLDRVESEAAHPALTLAARGHVAGHAATLSRALYLGATAEPLTVLRALELSRVHLDSATDLSAAALDGASRAAFMYASMTAAAEAPSEDDLGHWMDAVMWGLSALQTQQRVRTTAATRFDIAACAVRVSAAAAQLDHYIGERSFTDTAYGALAIAEALAPDPRLIRARAKLDTSSSATVTGPTRRRATRPAGPATRGQPTTRSTLRLHTAWRTLADSEQLAGQAAAELRQRAAAQFCDLVAQNQIDLGGKQRGGGRGVTIAHDPHGLARRLIVLKRVAPETANREFDALTHLSTWLDDKKATLWSVPEPLGVVAVDDDAILVMRRLPGHTIAHHALEHLDGRGDLDPLRLLNVAAVALGEFHTAMLEGPRVPPEDVTHTFRDAASSLTNMKVGDGAARLLATLLTSDSQLAKKDSHAGNWIWSTASGGLIMLDFEGSTTRPAMLELATLLDDLPLIGLESSGWDTRLELAHHYLASLPTAYRPAAGELRPRLEAYALHVAVTGLARLKRRGWGTSSRGTRHARFQHDHYRGLAISLARAAENEEVRRAAELILAQADP